MKISMKRVAALVLTLVMVFGLLPVMNNTANAVNALTQEGSLTDSTIGWTSTAATGSPNYNNSKWSASGNAITGIVQGTHPTAKMYMAASATLKITNNKSVDANLSFDYSIVAGNGGTVSIDGQTVTGGSFEKKLASKESVEILLTAKRSTAGVDNMVTLNITNLILASASNEPVTTTFEAPSFGSYTVAYGSENLTVGAGTASQTATNLPTVAYTLTATPGSGYKFVGWYNVTTDTYLSTELTYTGSFEEASTVKAIIVPENTSVFKVKDNYFSDLNAAVAYAQAKSESKITLVQSGILPAGSYTIPAGITLLIPMDTEYTPTRTDDEDFGVAPEFTTEYATPYAFLTLTMADGAELTVNGTLDIESKHTTLQGGKTTGGRPCGPYGAIYMNPEAAITVNNGANLYAWGYIYGDGSVTANSGAQVYEIMQVTDFPGGSNMSSFVDTDPTVDTDGDGNPSNDYIKTFPFSQYYVQNIEVALTLKEGAAEYVYITMTAGGESMGLPVRFIGEGGMFVPGEGGTIVKDYDPSTDRLNVTVNGDASMAGIALDLTGTKYEGAVEDVLHTSKVDSATFVLTLNGNISINIASGTTTVKQDLSLLPGVEITVAEGATLVVAQRTYADGENDNLTFYGTGGYNIYVWDLDNWGKFVFSNKYLSALTYSPTTGRYTRSYSDLKDVKIDVNGTILSEGYIYSTVNFDDVEWVPLEGAGAQVISTGKTGKIVMQNGGGLEDMAYCLDGSSAADSGVYIDSVWLQNGDGSYLLTDSCDPGTTYNYCDVHDLWYTEGHGNCVVVNTVEITWVVNGEGAPEEYLLGDTPSYKGGTPTKSADGCTVYTFAGWATSADGQPLASLPAVSGEATYFAVFTASEEHDWDSLYIEYNGDGTHTETYQCKNDTSHYNYVNEDCTNGKDPHVHLCDDCFGQLTDCKDDNRDHLCDDCRLELSDCEDMDGDHICDYAGCRKPLTSCEDSNADHYCDYAGCQLPLSICEDENKDHKCDYIGCQFIMTGCEDLNLDHKCDYTGCQKGLTSCEDNNEDHLCDYVGCQATLSSCADNDEDHYCDYIGCQKTLSSCKDDNGDHVCDYAGCQNSVSSCVDNNEDHCCDYTGCGATVSICRDLDGDHICDYVGCRATLSDCADADMDHICDSKGCNATLSSCEDINEDHLCDYPGCQKPLSSCVDENRDHYCDFINCGAEIDSCVDSNEDHFCDYVGCQAEMSSCEDMDENHICDYNGCLIGLSSCEDNDEDHFCDYTGCGARDSYCDDIDQDHYCDYVGCGVETSYCEDSDEDHFCDYTGCNAELSVCTPGTPEESVLDEADCQPGLKEITVYCTICGEWMSTDTEEIPALGHGYSEGWEYMEYDDYHEVWCADCWDYSYNEDHDYGEDHVCDCGAEERYILTFMNGDSVFETTSVPYGAAANLYGMPVPTAPTGYGWDGWYTADGTTKYEHGVTWDADMVFYATFVKNSYTVTWVVGGNTTTETYEYGDTPSFSGSTDKANDGCTTYTFDGWDKDIEVVTGDVTYTAQYITGVSHVGEVSCTNLNNGYHKVTCDTCGDTVAASEAHDYTYDVWKHKCACGAVEEFKLTVVYGINGEYTYEAMVPYWTSMDELDEINNIPWTIYVNDATRFGHYSLDDFYWDMDGDGDLDADRYFTEGYMGAKDLYVEVRYRFTGFAHDGNGWQIIDYGYMPKNQPVMFTMSDLYENGSEEEFEGFYLADANGYRIENGLGRYYYLGECPFNGVNYVPNAEDIAYYENKGLTFIDKEMTWYYFGADGKWQYNYTGLVGDSYVVNGQAAWHVGLVEIDGDYYYFKGDEVNGGNVMVTGDYYVGRNNTDLAVVIGGLYTFGADGKLCLYNGITEVNGVLRYYENAQLMLGNGLTQVGENFIYVNAYGELIVSDEYYVPANEYGIKSGVYTFDANGFLVIPEEEPGKSGLYFEDGKWYYYVDGAKAYCAGLIEIDGNWVYVKSDGSLATGAYYVTNTNGHATIASGSKCLFDENGYLQENLNGVVDGYYYVDNTIAYAAGLIETENGYIYVKSNGQIVVGTNYWITNVNETGIEPGNYQFDENGYMIYKGNGIVDGYYYVNGKVAYGAGLIEIEPGKYIYVRSNGAVATGLYWPTNHHGLLPEGVYDFGEDGIYEAE